MRARKWSSVLVSPPRLFMRSPPCVMRSTHIRCRSSLDDASFARVAGAGARSSPATSQKPESSRRRPMLALRQSVSWCTRRIDSHRGSCVRRRHCARGIIDHCAELAGVGQEARPASSEQLVQFSLDQQHVVERLVCLGREDGQRFLSASRQLGPRNHRARHADERHVEVSPSAPS